MKPKAIDIGVKIDEGKLHALDLPIEKIQISEIIHNAEICYLEKEGTDDWNLSPNELINNFNKEISHAKRVNAVDLSFPVYIFKHNGNWIILDGVHRFTKALMQGDKSILVKKVPKELINSITNHKS